MIRDPERLLSQLRALHDAIRDAVVAQTERVGLDALSAIVGDEGGDTIFAIDRVGEDFLLEFCERVLAPERSLVLVAEGLPDTGLGPGRTVLPRGRAPDDAEIQLLIDPIDGTRGLMYQKRSAWILTGVAPNLDAATRLRDIQLAVQTEIPLAKAHLSDQLWATRGAGIRGERYNRLTRERTPIRLRPSASASVEQGFASFSRFFPGYRAVVTQIDEEVMHAALGEPVHGRAQAFEDQYISTGGQLYELIAGHDRFICDLRPVVEPLLARQGHTLGICCHPYDLAAVLVAEEAGVLVTDGRGNPLDAPLDVESDVAWAGYANPAIRAQIEPPLLDALRQRGLA
jgi:hypothetical protein